MAELVTLLRKHRFKKAPKVPNAIIDLDARVSIAYVMNYMEANLMGDKRGGGVAAAVYQSLAA